VGVGVGVGERREGVTCGPGYLSDLIFIYLSVIL